MARGYFSGRPVRKDFRRFLNIGVGLLASFLLQLIISAFGPGKPAVLAVLFAISVASSLWLMLIYGRIRQTITESGLEARRFVLGFREFLSRAEKYRLDWQITEQKFSAYMPYALAFGVLEPFLHANLPTVDRLPEWFSYEYDRQEVVKIRRFAKDMVILSRSFGSLISALADVADGK